MSDTNRITVPQTQTQSQKCSTKYRGVVSTRIVFPKNNVNKLPCCPELKFLKISDLAAKINLDSLRVSEENRSPELQSIRREELYYYSC